MMKPRLLAIAGSLTNTVRQLVDGQISIGRDEASQLCLMDYAVSRRPCAMQQVDGRYELADRDSHNGTFVNGVPVGRKFIDHGDMIRIGNSEFVFLTHEGAALATAKLRLSDASFKSTLTTLRMEQQAAHPTFGAEAARMARDLPALFTISNVINSIREAHLLTFELLRLISEVVPADHGAVLLQTDLDEETNSICTWS